MPDGLQHKDLVTHISHITLPNGADRYVTCGKDGVVKVWNAKVGDLGPHFLLSCTFTVILWYILIISCLPAAPDLPFVSCTRRT